jgi:small-conductance mechanosensitive channel
VFKRLIISVCLILSGVLAQTYLTQTTPTFPQSQPAQLSRYPVQLDENVLFYVREGLKSLSAQQRAAAISKRIKEAAQDPLLKTESVTVSEDEISSDIVAGDQFLMAILDKDGRAEGRTRQELANEYAAKIRAGIEKYRQDHSAQSILIGVLLTLVTTLVFVVLLVLLNRLYNKLHAAMVERTLSRLRTSRIQYLEVVLRAILTGVVKILRILAVLWILYVYLNLTLSFFPWTRPLALLLLDLLVGPLKTMGQAVQGYIPNLFFLGVLVFVTAYLLRVIHFFFEEVEKGKIALPRFYEDWARPTYNIIRLLAIAFVAVVAYPYIPGSRSEAFRGVSIFLGVLFSLGSSSAVANMVAGVILTYMRAFKVGDVVEIAGSRGIVTGVSLLVTRIRTPKKVEITIPNSMVLGTHVTNFSSAAREGGVILHTSVTIGYDAPWRQVEALLLMAAERTPGLLREPSPYVLQEELGDFYVTYQLNVATDAPQKMNRIYSDLHKNIQDAFNEYGVQIMSPNYEADREVPTVVPKAHWYAPPAKPPDSQKSPVIGLTGDENAD